MELVVDFIFLSKKISLQTSRIMQLLPTQVLKMPRIISKKLEILISCAFLQT
jgi:hypothetical protein